MNKHLLSCALVALLAGCVEPVGHQDAGIQTPSVWTRLAQTLDQTKAPLASNDAAEVEQRWWKHFNDPALDGLIEAALAGNKNLGIAKARVEEAKANRALAIGNLLPRIDATGSATRQNLGFLYNKPIGLLEADAQASWELDLFGKNQARAAAAKAIAESAEAERRGVMVSLIADVARSYFDARNLARQIAITEQNLESQRKTLELTKAQFEGALLSDFDVQRASAQVSVTEAQLPLLRSAYDAARNRLSVLTGTMPGSQDKLFDSLPPAELPLTPIVIAAPAKILANRPDVEAAERRFAATISVHTAAVRELLPTISLGAMYGIQESSLTTAHPWNIGASLTQPIFNFGLITSGIDLADAQKQEAFLAYQQSVLEAVEDMDNALSAFGQENVRNKALNAAQAQTRKAADLARQQFESGELNLLDVLTAERDALNAESAAAASDADLRKDMVRVYAAAGGGWNIESAPEAPSAPVSLPPSAPAPAPKGDVTVAPAVPSPLPAPVAPPLEIAP